MPSTLTYPGVYIEELPSGVHTISGVATSIAAFVGATLRGPTDDDPLAPITINGFGDFERIFGGLWSGSQMGYAVRDFFLNGGGQALIIRIFETDNSDGAKPARTAVTAGDFPLEAAYPGSWATNLRVSIDPNVSDAVAAKMGLSTDQLFNLTIRDVSPNGRTEQFNNLTVEDRIQRIDTVLASESKLARWKGTWSKPALTKLKAARDSAKTLADKQKDLATSPDDPDKKQAVIDAQKAYD
ncbi:MAG: phage tail sheath family protein, partial [Verrucomicrobiota bacterium]|nr:phage tail sheath family protein [Verrucomicrobiota bacterium]